METAQQGTSASPRPSASDIHARVLESSRRELERSSVALAVSGLTAGLLMGLSALGVSAAMSLLGHTGADRFIAMALYPVGFIAVIVGRAQLFTENTLYPVVVTLEEPRMLGDTLRLWVVVLAANLVGASVFVVLVSWTGAVSTDVVREIAHLGEEAVAHDSGALFWAAVIGGWLVALTAWLVMTTDEAMGWVALIWVPTFLIGIGGFQHVIAAFSEVGVGFLEGNVELGDALGWLVAVTLGNIVGGVGMVALLNHGQVKTG